MQLTETQIARFKEIHASYGGLEYSDEEIKEIAVGVAGYYSELFKVWLRVQKEKSLDVPEVS